jgi:cytochrome P450
MKRIKKLVHSRLDAIQQQSDPLRQNRMLFRSLQDDLRRVSLYRELAAKGFPALVFKSVMRKGGNAASWPSEDVYLLTARKDIDFALQHGRVTPYAELDSGGKFMLGSDDPGKHDPQRTIARRALDFTPEQVERCVREALVRTMVLRDSLGEFDLVKDVAEQAAIRLMAIVFGMPARSYFFLEQAMRATYTRLTFQIIGRHFSPDDGLPPPDAERSRELKQKLEEVALKAARGEDFPEWWDTELWEQALQQRSASAHLAGLFGQTGGTTKTMILGLIAGTVGNVASAVANTIDYFFRARDAAGNPLIDRAMRVARTDEYPPALKALVNQALSCRPPAPFLARTSPESKVMTVNGSPRRLPAGSHLLLAMGADVPCDMDRLFGGAPDAPAFAHSCIGRHLALPLVYETVRQVLQLPGLSRVIDDGTEQPKPLKKRWGAICRTFPLRYARERRMNQQPLFLVLPIKEPTGENALKLEELTRVGASVIERALEDAKNVHFAWFGLIENRTKLAMYTVYDGDFDAYVEHFALKVPLFNEQFQFLKDAPRTPVRDYPREFVEFIRAHNQKPVAGYFYSAYPRVGVAEIINAQLGHP